jgi:hypothetical protein
LKARLTGSCHCGAVRFESELDTAVPSSRCNCSVCSKSRYWKMFVAADAFTLLEGAGSLAEYRFGSGRVAHMFCRRCGVKLFGHGDKASFPDPFYAINVACLDDPPEAFWLELKVVHQDGRHDRWETTPVETARARLGL